MPNGKFDWKPDLCNGKELQSDLGLRWFDTKDENGDENAGGLENEHGSFLYSDGKEVRLGVENIQGRCS